MSIQQDVITYIKSELASAAPELTPQSDLTQIIDSTAVMELVVWMEDHFGFQVELDDITPEQFGSVDRLAEFIERNRTQ